MAGIISQDMIQALVAREMQNHPHAIDPKPGLSLGLPPSAPASTLSPEMAATVGGLADAAGTYAGLRSGAASEGNPMLAGGGAAKAGIGLLGQLLAQKGITKLLRKFSPGAADALAANAGARQLGYGAQWGELMTGGNPGASGHEAFNASLNRNSYRK